MDYQELINRISKLQTYKINEQDDIILISKQEVILEILKYFNEKHFDAISSNNMKIVIGD